MIVRRKFKIKALFEVTMNVDKITNKEIRPDIDWDVDPVIGITTNERIWVEEDGKDVMYLITMVEYDEKDHQHFIDKGWVPVE